MQPFPALMLCGLLFVGPLPAGAEISGTTCAEDSEAAAERVIEDCDALLTNKETAETRVPAVFLARAAAFVRQGRLRLAIDDLGSVIERRPDDAGAFVRRAELHRTLGDADAAIRDFSAAIRLEPGNASALFARAELYHAMTDWRRALSDYAAVRRIEPSHQAAAQRHKALVQEIERLGATMPLQPR